VRAAATGFDFDGGGGGEGSVACSAGDACGGGGVGCGGDDDVDDVTSNTSLWPPLSLELLPHFKPSNYCNSLQVALQYSAIVVDKAAAHETFHSDFGKPQTPNPKPQTPNPKLQTPNPKPQTPNPKPQTPNPNPQAGYLTVLNPIVRECSAAMMQVIKPLKTKPQTPNIPKPPLQFIDALVSSAAAAAAAADVVALPLAKKDTAILSQIDWMCRDRSPLLPPPSPPVARV